MERSKILQLFLQHGVQVDRGALDMLVDNTNLLEIVLKTNKDSLPTTITPDFIKTLSPNDNYFQSNNSKFSVSQLSKVLTNRYDFFRNLLVNKDDLPNLISINKISEKTKQFSVIGIISDIRDNLILEDLTGEETFKITKEMQNSLVDDEVIGIACERHSGKNIVKQIIYPEMPLKKEPQQTEVSGTLFFISDIHMDSPDFNKTYYKNFLNWLEEQKDTKAIILGGISKNNDDIKRFLSDMCNQIEFYHENELSTSPVSIQIENIHIHLSYGPFLEYYMKLWCTTPQQTLINLMRKRNLNPLLTQSSYNNNFLLKSIPDIIVIGGLQIPTSTNYKGTTILTTGSFLTEPTYWKIDLQTRETFKINFV